MHATSRGNFTATSRLQNKFTFFAWNSICGESRHKSLFTSNSESGFDLKTVKRRLKLSREDGKALRGAMEMKMKFVARDAKRWAWTQANSRSSNHTLRSWFCACNIFMPKFRFRHGNDHKANERVKYFCATHQDYVDSLLRSTILGLLGWDHFWFLNCLEMFIFQFQNILSWTLFSIILTGHFIYRWTSTFDGTWGRAAGWADCSATWRCSECERRESSFPTPRDSRRRQRSSRDSKLRRPYDKCRSCHHSLSISKQQLPSSLKESSKD